MLLDYITNKLSKTKFIQKLIQQTYKVNYIPNLNEIKTLYYINNENRIVEYNNTIFLYQLDKIQESRWSVKFNNWLYVILDSTTSINNYSRDTVQYRYDFRLLIDNCFETDLIWRKLNDYGLFQYKDEAIILYSYHCI